MYVLAIDPGNVESAYVYIDTDTLKPVDFGKIPNEDLLERCFQRRGNWEEPWRLKYRLAIEMVASYGMAVGATVFDTCVWIGRYIQAAQDGDWRGLGFEGYDRVYRKDVKMHICGQTKAEGREHSAGVD
jgi:hypothetical protein